MRKLVRILILLLAASCTSQEAVPTDVLPDIWPDYAGVTIPRSIAPLNFEVRVADAVQAVLSNGSREVRVRGSFVGIPLRKWRSLTAAGDSLTVQVKARIDGQWRAYLPLSIHLSDDPVDLSLVYRRVDPGYETYARMGIYQRDLASFREKALFENTRIDPGCVNCHSFAHCDPASMQLHFRGGKGGTLIHSEAYGSDVYNMSNPLPTERRSISAAPRRPTISPGSATTCTASDSTPGQAASTTACAWSGTGPTRAFPSHAPPTTGKASCSRFPTTGISPSGIRKRTCTPWTWRAATSPRRKRSTAKTRKATTPGAPIPAGSSSARGGKMDATPACTLPIARRTAVSTSLFCSPSAGRSRTPCCCSPTTSPNSVTDLSASIRNVFTAIKEPR